MKVAILRVSPEALRELLHLPSSAEVVDVRSDVAVRGVLEVKVYGAGWEVPMGAAIPRTEGTVSKDGERVVIDWGFPPEAG